MVLTPANQAQLCQVVVDVDAQDLDKEEVELTALQRCPGEAAEQAIVGEPPQDSTGPWVGPAREPTVEQEGQVEEEQAAHEVDVQPQVDADGLLKPEPAPECPQREQERQGSQLSKALCCTTAGPRTGTKIASHLSQPDKFPWSCWHIPPYEDAEGDGEDGENHGYPAASSGNSHQGFCCGAIHSWVLPNMQMLG